MKKIFLLLVFVLISPMQNILSSNYQMHGVTVEDPFEYLEQMQSEQTQKWLDGQEAQANNYFSQISNRDKIKESLKANSNYDIVVSVVETPFGQVCVRREAQNDKLCIYLKDTNGVETLIVSPMAYDNGDNAALSGFFVSPNNQLVCFGIKKSGSDFTTVYFYDLKINKILETTLTNLKFSMPVFSKDCLGLYYEKWQEAEFGNEDQCLGVFYHNLKENDSSFDKLFLSMDLFKDQLIFVDRVICDGKYLVLINQYFTGKMSGLKLLDINTKEILTLVEPNVARCELIEEVDGILYLTTDFNAPNHKLVAIDINQLDMKYAKDVIKESENYLSGALFTQNYIITHYFNDCKSQVLFFNYQGKLISELPIDGAASVSFTSLSKENIDYKSDTFYYSLKDFTTPNSFFHYDIKNKNGTLFHQALKKNQDIVTSQVFFTSKDGTQVPMFIVHHKDVQLNGKNPTLVYGYGGFGVSLTPFYAIHHKTWLEMGGVYVLVNLRGGLEYGSSWHENGRLHNKQNVFDDFIAATEALINLGYTSSEKVAINGGSNGGLLVGACLIQRPDLFKAAISQVGVLDMLKFHKFTIGKAWMSDFGNPDNFADFKALYAYSPYHNIKDGAFYPSTLIMAAEGDDRVVPLHSYKFAARLQQAQADKSPIILKVARKEGHSSGGGSLSKYIDSYTDLLSFLYKELNMEEQGS